MHGACTARAWFGFGFGFGFHGLELGLGCEGYCTVYTV